MTMSTGKTSLRKHELPMPWCANFDFFKPLGAQIPLTLIAFIYQPECLGF